MYVCMLVYFRVSLLFLNTFHKIFTWKQKNNVWAYRLWAISSRHSLDEQKPLVKIWIVTKNSVLREGYFISIIFIQLFTCQFNINSDGHLEPLLSLIWGFKDWSSEYFNNDTYIPLTRTVMMFELKFCLSNIFIPKVGHTRNIPREMQ
jgi:hypothetical protein